MSELKLFNDFSCCYFFPGSTTSMSATEHPPGQSLLGFSSDQVQHSRPKAAAPRAATYSNGLNSKEFHLDLQSLRGKKVGSFNKRNTQKGLFSGALGPPPVFSI